MKELLFFWLALLGPAVEPDVHVSSLIELLKGNSAVHLDGSVVELRSPPLCSTISYLVGKIVNVHQGLNLFCLQLLVK